MKLTILSLAILFYIIDAADAQNSFPASGNVAIGNDNPQASLDINGSLILRDYSNVKYNGSSIVFSSYSDANTYPGSKIRNSLIYANGATSNSQLILSSYFSSYLNELTLSNGMVGINTTNPQNTLDVNGKIRAKEIRVEANWPDFVFAKGYRLMPLSAVEVFIIKNKRLPEIPSDKEIHNNGLELAKMNSKLMQKIEELTLYIIQQQKQIQLQNTRLIKLEKRHQSFDDLKHN